MKNLLKLLGIFAFALIATACGGGGGGGGSSSPPPTTYSVSGTTIANAKVDVTGAAIASTTANASGSYSLLLANGNYTFTPKITGYVFSPTSTAVTVNGTNVSGINFSATQSTVTTYSISGAVSGGAQVGVTVRLSPDGSPAVTIATAITGSSGSYVFSGVPNNGAYTVTPLLAGYTFTPASISFILNGGNVTGVNFTTPVPMLTTGKILYPCIGGICSQDLSTGIITMLWNGVNFCPPGIGGCADAYPDVIVPSRARNKIAFMGSNLNGVMSLSMSTGVVSADVPILINGGTFSTSLNQYCATNQVGDFDISPLGEFAVFANHCNNPDGLPVEHRDIFIAKMDGTSSSASTGSIRVTDDYAKDDSPAFCGTDAVNGNVFVCFVSNKSGMRGVWKQAVDMVSGSLVGPQILVTNVLTSIMSNELYGTPKRMFSVNADYTQMAFMKDEGGVSHIVVMPLAGGAEVDLGEGSFPYWGLDGSNKILYSDNRIWLYATDVPLWAINPDGTGKVRIPIPSNQIYWFMAGTQGDIIFAPAGY